MTLAPGTIEPEERWPKVLVSTAACVLLPPACSLSRSIERIKVYYVKWGGVVKDANIKAE